MKKETRKIGREPKKIELNLSKDKVVLRAIIAGVCLFLGVGLILNSCSNMLNKSQYLVIDYPEINDVNEVESKLFDGNVELSYFYSSDSEDSRSLVMSKINTILEENMVNLHKLCDYNQLYKENNEIIHNLKYINDNPNTWINVTDSLYSLLKEAESLRINTEGKYSIFSGKLNELWGDIFATYGVHGNDSSNVTLFDPEYDSNKKELIDLTVNKINKETTNLEFKDEKKEVKFNVLEEDKEYVKLDLGLLETSFYIDTLKKLLLEEKLNSGYISSSDGMIATLGINKNSTGWIFNSYSYQSIFNVDGSIIYDYSFDFNGALSYMSFNPLLNIKNHSYASKNYYYLDIEDNINIRSMIINAKTGYSNNSAHSTFTFSDNTNISNQLVDNYNLFFNEFEYNNTYLTKYENNENYGAIVIFNDGNTNIEFKGKTTMLYSKLVSNYFNEEYIPYVTISEVVQAKIEAKEGE